MSRKAILGRAALSFDTTDGILDIDQIMETDPWKHIDDFVQRNFMQDILNQFNERMTLEPDRVPAELEAKKSKRSFRKRTNQPSQENPVKEAKKKNDSVADNQHSMRSEVTLSQGVSFESEEKQVSDMETTRKKRKSNTKKQKRVWDKTSSRNQRTLGNGSKSSVKPSVTAKRSRKAKKNNERQIENTNETENEKENENKNESNDENKNSVADTSEAENGFTMKLGTEDCAKEKNGGTQYQSMMDISTNTNCGSHFATSTPDVSIAMESNKNTLAKNVSNGSKGCVTKNSSNNFKKSPSNEPEIDKRIAKFERDTKLKLKRSDEEPKKELVYEKKAVVPYCEQNGKTKRTTEKRKMGKYERILIEKKKARRDRKIRREARKAEKAIEKFGHHVTTIAQKMGYLPKDHSSSYSDSDDSSDYSDESSYTSSSSSYSECSCSCSCSCGSSESSYSESDEYSEYTVCSCSGHSDSSSSDTSE